MAWICRHCETWNMGGGVDLQQVDTVQYYGSGERLYRVTLRDGADDVTPTVDAYDLIDEEGPDDLESDGNSAEHDRYMCADCGNTAYDLEDLVRWVDDDDEEERPARHCDGQAALDELAELNAVLATLDA